LAPTTSPDEVKKRDEFVRIELNAALHSDVVSRSQDTATV